MAQTKRELQRKKRQREQKRAEYPHHVVKMWKEVMRQRIEKTKALIDFRGMRGDLHSHSIHSDGTGTVAELAGYRDASGMDFLFVTDHGGLTQKRDCVKFDKMWWGQEPGTEYHHLGIAGSQKKYVVEHNLVNDWNAVLEMGAIPFIPHPTGWFPNVRYTQEQKDALSLLGDTFTMEIINGANQIFDCWDVTDEWSVELWDLHLSQGKHVTALGNSDAHLPHAIGDIWNGVSPDDESMEGVMDAVRRGRSFVSDAPLVSISAQQDGGPVCEMGGDLIRSGEAALQVRILAADSFGLREVTLIRNGKPVERWDAGGETVASHVFSDNNVSDAVYYRMECRAMDNRRAYTNPVYIRG